MLHAGGGDLTAETSSGGDPNTKVDPDWRAAVFDDAGK
jgi:hypothetical protein